MPTLKGRVLLGWMPRDEAIRFLQNDCHFDPQLSAEEAERIWAPYRATVEALPPRAFSVANNHGLSPVDAGHAARLMAFLASIGQHDVIGVKRLDLRDLAVHQYYVVTERAEEYAARLTSATAWNNECLPLGVPPIGYQWKHQSTVGMSSYIECDVPHGEWTFGPIGNGQFAALQGLRNVTAMEGADRTFLWAGYHRSFAKVLTTPIAKAPTAPVAVARNVIALPPVAVAAPGVAANTGIDDFCPLGAKAAKFGDFFVEGLFMDVNLRKKRYQLQVHANWVALDDPT